MSISRKYGRTYHYDFSLGTTSDDRINNDWWEDMQKFNESIDTEKLDGENTCLNGIGIFARSHAAPTKHPWSNYLKQKYSMIKNDLKENNVELFGENIYAQHSIIYPNIDNHFYLFGVRVLDKWLSWKEVQWYAEIFDYPTVPVLNRTKISDTSKEGVINRVANIVSNESTFGSIQNGSMEPCTMEGLVTRNIGEYSVNKMSENVFKWVRKNHVSTDEHWSRNWKRAPLIWEKNKLHR